MTRSAVRRQHGDIPSPDDDILAVAARQRDTAALRLLVARHNQRLFRVARGVLRDDSEAEDVVQETYVKALAKLDGFRGHSSFSTWLTRIALNEAVGRLRGRRRTVDVTEIDIASATGTILPFPTVTSAASPESETARTEVRTVLERAVDEMPDSFRLVFILRDVHGLDTEETATLLELRPETVKTRLHRARRLMRDNIETTFAAGFAELFPFAGARCASIGDRVLARMDSGVGSQTESGVPRLHGIAGETTGWTVDSG